MVGGRARKLDAQPFHDATVNQMLVNDFVQISMIHIGIPDCIRIDDDDRPFGAAIQATGIIDAHLVGYGGTQRLDALLDIITRLLRAALLATL